MTKNRFGGAPVNVKRCNLSDRHALGEVARTTGYTSGKEVYRAVAAGVISIQGLYRVCPEAAAALLKACANDELDRELERAADSRYRAAVEAEMRTRPYSVDIAERPVPACQTVPGAPWRAVTGKSSAAIFGLIAGARPVHVVGYRAAAMRLVRALSDDELRRWRRGRAGGLAREELAARGGSGSGQPVVSRQQVQTVEVMPRSLTIPAKDVAAYACIVAPGRAGRAVTAGRVNTRTSKITATEISRPHKAHRDNRS